MYNNERPRKSCVMPQDGVFCQGTQQSILPHEVDGFFRDHDRRGIGVRAWDLRHDRRIGYPESVDPPNSKLWVDDGFGVQVNVAFLLSLSFCVMSRVE